MDNGDRVFDFCRREVMKSGIVESCVFNSSSRKIRFQFNLTFHHTISDWMVTDGNTVALELPPSQPPFNEYRLATVTAGSSLSDNDVRTAVEEAIGNCVERDDRRDLIEIAFQYWRGYYNRTGAYRHGVFHLNFSIPVNHRHVYVVDSDYPRMVPAADSSFRLLEKHEVEEEDPESRCSICLEEFGSVDDGGIDGDGDGDGEEEALRMPCMHVFHGGCIKEWLRRSHYCPLCRYQMPTHDFDVQDFETD